MSTVSKVLLSGLSLLVLGCATVLYLLLADPPKRHRYLIPDGYRGWLCVTFAVGGAPALPIEDGYELVKFDQAGVVSTSSAGKPGKLKDEFIVYTPTASRKLDVGSEMGGGFTVAPGTNYNQYTFMFWVSPNAKLEQPEFAVNAPHVCGPYHPKK